MGKVYVACVGLKNELRGDESFQNMGTDYCKKKKRTTKDPDSIVNQTDKLIQMALDCLTYSKRKFTFGNQEKLLLKMGIHCGKVIAGVIGGHKPQFSLIGDTMNTASRVCSTGLEDKVTISSQVYQMIKNIYANKPEFIFYPRETEVLRMKIFSQLLNRQKGKE